MNLRVRQPKGVPGILLSGMKACVIGAGTMGAGIAAHLSNLGFEVTLLDLTRESAEACFERAKKIKPPHFYSQDSAQHIRLGGIDQDLELAGEADWVCEAIIENMEAKRDLYRRLLPILRPDAMVSSNTSSLPLTQLAEGLPEDFRRRFLGTHFFNPPRYLKLLELIPTADTTAAEIERQTRFLEDHCGRRVVLAKDTPGFIANRFGMWSMFHAIHTAEKLGLTVEQVDAICGPFLGRPRSAAFRLNDLVGLDVMAFIANIMSERCLDDPHRDALRTPASMAFLMEKGWMGQKSGQGYYRKEGKELLAFDLRTHAYRNLLEADFDSLKAVAKKPLGVRVRDALQAKDEAGEFLREHLIPVLKYATYLKEEVSHTVQDFDRVMMWGFGWEMGPFAMIDAIGADALGLSEEPFYGPGWQRAHTGEQAAIPEEPAYRTILDYPIVEARKGFNVRDLGDGVLAVALSSKMGVIDPELCADLSAWLEPQEGPMVLCSEQRAFSVGFDLKFFLAKQEESDWGAIEAGLKALQDLSILLTRKRIVAAVHGYCLGAGFEIATACSSIAAHPEANIGLPESKVGLLPGGAGACRMRLRHQTSLQDLVHGLLTLVRGQVSTSAADALHLGYLRRQDTIVSHPDRVLTDAKALALTAEARTMPIWKEMEGPLAGMIDQALNDAKGKGEFSDHDVFIGHCLKDIFRKPKSFEEALAVERERFLDLMREGLTVARVRHMLETGKPLRN